MTSPVSSRILRSVFWFAASVASLTSSSVLAARFEYINEQGTLQVVDARLYGEGQGAIALELADGSLSIIPQEALKTRTPGDDPVPMTPQQMLARLESEFGAELFRGRVQKQYVVGVV
ncbi:MAG: hypothetical protein O3B86_07065, partial [Planctomycetota bacterium]|nr:hypothetical protein [Planctomycetota bacterium]